MPDTCALCRRPAELRNSHFLPAALYKAVAQVQAPYDDAPVMMSIPKGTAIQKNYQARKHALCAECEHRFSANGESQIIAACHRKDGEFKLRDRLQALEPCVIRNGRAIYYGHNLPADLSSAAYAYFALSIIWRASAIAWGGDTGVTPGCLGKTYEEAFRSFLLGDSDFPHNTAVNVHVYFDADPVTFMAFPTHKKVEVLGRRFSEHTLIIPGMTFKIWVGGGVSELEALSGSRPGHPTFFATKFVGSALHKRVLADTKALVPKGKLAREEP